MALSLSELLVACCAPAGAGWGTSPAGDAPLAGELHLACYGTTDRDAVSAEHRNRLVEAINGGPLLLGVPYASGSYGPNVSQAGPLGIRLAALQLQAQQGCWPGGTSTTVHDVGDVRYFAGIGVDHDLAPELLDRARIARGFAGTKIPIGMLSAAGAIAKAARREGHQLLTLGGDHSVSASAAGAYVGSHVGLVYFDQHADRSNGRDGIRLLHNSWVSCVVEACTPPVVVHVGGQTNAIAPTWPATAFVDIPAAMVHSDVDRAVSACIASLEENRCDSVYVSFDIDVLDRTVAPSTGLPATDGLMPPQAEKFLRSLAGAVRIVAADVMEVGPHVSDSTIDVDVTCRTGAAVMAILAELATR